MWLSLCTAGRSRSLTSLQGPQPPPCLVLHACSRAWEPCRSGPRLLTSHPSAWLTLGSHLPLEKSLAAGAQVVGAQGPRPLLPSPGPKLGFHVGLVESEGCAWPSSSLPFPQSVYDRCEALLRPPFDACHAYVSPLPFAASCTSDLCQ